MTIVIVLIYLKFLCLSNISTAQLAQKSPIVDGKGNEVSIIQRGLDAGVFVKPHVCIHQIAMWTRRFIVVLCEPSMQSLHTPVILLDFFST